MKFLFNPNMENFPRRLERLITELGMNQAKFADSVGESRATISKYMSIEKGYKPKFDNVCKILKAFPNLNCRWLILGEGEIWTTDYDQRFQEQLVMYQQKLSELDSAKKLVETQEKLIKFLENENQTLRNIS